MIAIFLGAGFSALGNVPLASQLFDLRPHVDTVSREDLIRHVQYGWENWHNKTGGHPEQYLAYLANQPFKQSWYDAVEYVALVIMRCMPRVKIMSIGFEHRKRITGHGLGVTSGVPSHEDFWKIIFRQTTDIAVFTTNYDILAERGLRLTPRPSLPRPGFYYGDCPEQHQLEGRGYPGFFASAPPETKGKIPLFKLHGSVSWEFSGNEIVRYHDCRPAIQGKAAIVAPTIEKSVHPAFQRIWDCAAEALSKADVWVIVGYSFPEYDEATNNLFRLNMSHRPRIHILNPDPDVFSRARLIFCQSEVHRHEGLPTSLGDLPEILD